MTIQQIVSNTSSYQNLVNIVKGQIKKYRPGLDPIEVIANIYLQLEAKEDISPQLLYHTCKVQVRSNNSKTNYIRKYANGTPVDIPLENIEIFDSTDIELEMDIANLTASFIKTLDKRQASLFNIYHFKDHKHPKELREYFKVSSTSIYRMYNECRTIYQDYLNYLKKHLEL